MDRNLTDITIVLDCSGSMESIRAPMEAALRSFVMEQAGQPGVCLFSLYRFNTLVSHVFSGALHPEIEITPLGMTALLDALGQAIDETGQRLARLPEASRPGKVIMLVVSDGLENASRTCTRYEIAQKIKHQREKYSWEVIFMGCNQNAILEGGNLGVRIETCCTHDATPKGIARAYAAMSCSVSNYRAGAELKINNKS